MKISAAAAHQMAMVHMYRQKIEPDKENTSKITPSNSITNGVDNSYTEPKKVERTHPGSLEDYLRYEEGIVHAINNVKKYIEIINIDYIEKSESKLDQLVRDFIKAANKFDKSEKESYKDQNFYGNMKNIQKSIIEELKNASKNLSRLYPSYESVIAGVKDKKDLEYNRDRNFTEKKRSEDVDAKLLNKRRQYSKDNKEILSIENVKNFDTITATIHDLDKIKHNLDYSKEKFNKNFFNEILEEKLKEIKKNYEITKKINVFLDSGHYENAIKELEKFKVDEKNQSQLKEMVKMQTIKIYTDKARYSTLHPAHSVFSIII